FKVFATVCACAFSCAASQSASTTPAPRSTRDFSAFQSIIDSNIFNTKRSPSYVRSQRFDTRRADPVDYVSLTGTMIDERGPRAFFYGNRSEYQKVLKPDDQIAGFKVTTIDYGGVILKSPTNEVKLNVGTQLSRKEGGPWQVGQATDNDVAVVASY